MTPCLPYMGSKRKLAARIVDTIISRHQGRSLKLYDLFGGGGAVSFEALQRPEIVSVVYNEKNTAVVNLLKYLRTNGMTEDLYRWYSRGEFQSLKEGTDYIAGLMQTCWSFGNNQKTYLYGRKVEPFKKALHYAIVYKNTALIEEMGLTLPPETLEGKLHERRLKVVSYIRKTKKQPVLMQNLISGQRIENVATSLNNPSRVQNLERCQHIENTVTSLNKPLILLNRSYDQVSITGMADEIILYCDIPYRGTGTYKEGAFNHEEFYEWAKNSPYWVYISEYNAPFYEIMTWEHRSSFSPTTNIATTEKLYCNKEPELAFGGI